MTDTNTDLGAEFRELTPHAGPIAPANGVAAIALAMAMKYHQIATVSDGALYQQYKLEGKNMVPLSLSLVFDTAIAIERHLMHANERIAKVIIDAINEPDDDVIEAEPPSAPDAAP